MRILMASPTLPMPTSGGRTRIYNLLKQLARRHEISLLSFIQPSESEFVDELRPYCKTLDLVPFAGFTQQGAWRNRLRGWSRILFSRRPSYVSTFPVEAMRLPLRNLVKAQRFDLVVFETLYLVELADEVRDLPRVLVEQNVESEVARRAYLLAGNLVHRARDWLTWRKLFAFEQSWLSRFPACVAVSEQDAALFRRMAPKTKVYVAPNGVDTEHFSPPNDAREDNVLLFFGTLNYQPNTEGLLWFCNEVFPRVKQAKPALVLEIVGSSPPPSVSALASREGVKLVGFVPDIRRKLWSATLSVVPLLVGGGTRLKILESLAAGCPVISTTIGAEGLDLTPGEHVLIADASAAFARGIVSLLDSAELRRRLAEAGRKLVMQRYDWRRIALDFEVACVAAVKLGSGIASAWGDRG